MYCHRMLYPPRLTSQNLTVFLTKVFSKKYTNPSSDIIEVLAGLDNVDTVFNDLVTALDNTISSGKTGMTYHLKYNPLHLIRDSSHTEEGCPSRPLCGIGGFPNWTAHILHTT